MPDILTQILSLSTIVLCFTIVGLVWIQRRAMEVFFPKLVLNNYWREFFVPVGPLGTGALFAVLVTAYPYPDMFKSAWDVRMAFGIFCGLISGLVYRLINKNLLDKLGSVAPGLASAVTPVVSPVIAATTPTEIVVPDSEVITPTEEIVPTSPEKTNQI